MTVLYPVAENAEAALTAPRGFAVRQREAERLAEGSVTFATDLVGPAFPSEAEALDAYAGRLDDERPERRMQVTPEARWCALRPVAPKGKRRRRTVAPINRDGRRWPVPDAAAQGPCWRLSVSYWRIGTGAPESPAEAARKLRRKAGAEGLDAASLRALAQQPLRAVRPQQPLDIGLFETRLPEAPHIIVSDE